MPPTIQDWLEQAVARLAGSPSPRQDSELLLMHVTGLDRAAVITRSQEALMPEQEAALRALLERRARGEPVAYLTGTRGFWTFDLTVSPAVLIPRPETELLVERALAHLLTDATATVADIGTGSGAIACAIALERPRTRVIASDISEDALAVARANAARLGLVNITFREGPYLQPLTGEAVDMVVSNPPYVRNADPHLMEGDLRFEPRQALQGGPDGLDAIRNIAWHARRHLRSGGVLLLEHGYDQQGAVTALLGRYGYRDIAGFEDAGGNPRAVEARKP